LIECRVVLIEYRAILTECRVLLIEDRVLWMKCRVLVIECRDLFKEATFVRVVHVCARIYIHTHLHTDTESGAQKKKEEERILMIGNTRQPFLCEKGDLKKMNTFFKDFKLFMPMPDYATMQVCVGACMGVCVCM